MLNYKTPLNAFPAPADKTYLCIYVNLRNFRKIQTHVYIEYCPSAYPLYLTNINKICKIGIMVHEEGQQWSNKEMGG